MNLVRRVPLAVGEEPPRGLEFWCPACETTHRIRVDVPNAWTYDGNESAPTITPSVKVMHTRFSELAEKQYEHWQQSGEHPPGGKYDSREDVCHTVVTAGKIQFCGDCTHAMAGQLVPMIPIPSSENSR